MNAKTGIALLGVGTLGFLLGFWLKGVPGVAGARPAAARPSFRARAAAPAEDSPVLDALRARVKALERRLADATARAEDSATNGPPQEQAQAGARRRFGPPGAAEMRAHMEEMRLKDPARFAQMTNRFARMQASRQERIARKLDILSSVDVSRLTEEQRQKHERYQDLLVQQEELREAMRPDNAEVTDEQRDELFKRAHALGEELRTLAEAERQVLLAETARAYGVKGEAGAELVDTVTAVIQATDVRGGRGGGPGGPPPGGMPPQ